jgi:hypothetical protein
VKDVVVVGGGAAGVFGGIACAEADPHCRVTVLERGPKALAKVRVSGGGRCNVTHACFEPRRLAEHYPRGGKALLGAFHRFGPRDTIAWFESRGVKLKTEPDGRVFPASDDSATIVEALLSAARAAGVQWRFGADLADIEKSPDNPFQIRFHSGETLQADRLLLATGGSPQGYAWAKSLGHSIQPPVPSLFTFTVPDDRLRGLAGVSVVLGEVGIKDTRFRQAGPILITHAGLSGPAVITLSSWAARYLSEAEHQASLEIKWLAGRPEETTRRLKAFRAGRPRQSVWTCPFHEIPRRLWERLVNAAGIRPGERWADLPSNALDRLSCELSGGNYLLAGKSPFKEEFVTCGGIPLKEVEPKTMASRPQSGLYLAGEVLDIDGVTGGFNFQSAWTTGYLAGRAMGE